jgi:four helix bundle protein
VGPTFDLALAFDRCRFRIERFGVDQSDWAVFFDDLYFCPSCCMGIAANFMSFLFEKLEVYQRAVDFAERISALTKTFPAQGHYHLVDQLRRASVSISLNIAEGNGRWHVKDRKNFFWIARGSVFECVPLTELCKRENLITENTRDEVKTELEVLSKMLTALINGTDKRDI